MHINYSTGLKQITCTYYEIQVKKELNNASTYSCSEGKLNDLNSLTLRGKQNRLFCNIFDYFFLCCYICCNFLEVHDNESVILKCILSSKRVIKDTIFIGSSLLN